MKLKSIVIGIAAGIYSLAAYATTTPAAPVRHTMHLDQSKDISFDRFIAGTFALQVLQTKNIFDNDTMIIGGSLQTDWQHWHGNVIDTTTSSFYQNGRALYLTQADIDFMGNINRWLTSFLTLADAHIGQPGPSGNYVFMYHAFFLLGNLDKFPVYVTAGINTIPFGLFYGSGVWDVPLTGGYFQPAQAPQVSIAYFKNGLNVSTTKYSDQTNHQNHTVFSALYNKTIGEFNYSLGAGYLTQLQSNETGNNLTHRARSRGIASGYELGNILDFNASIGYGQFSLMAEYDQGSENVASNTSIPQAASVTAYYTHNIAGRDATFGISRSRSFHLINVPVSLAGQDSIPLSSEGLRSAWAVSAYRTFFNNNFSLGLNFAQQETYLAANTYTCTLELFLYL